MKFALVDNSKSEAIRGVRGVCPNCSTELVAKCGNIKIHHWAHKMIRNCDPWWENETEWHRGWKNYFKPTWQEIILTDEFTGEKHIADIRTDDGLVVEFQHSSIDPIEMIKREKFYKKMVWVVDGTRLKKDFPRFLKGKADLRSTNSSGIYSVPYPNECFHNSWINNSVPVVFDFKGTEIINDINDLRNNLYIFFPKVRDKMNQLVCITRQSFIESIKNGTLFNTTQPTKDPVVNPNNTITKVRHRPSPYFLDRGKWKKRKRI